MNLLYMLFGKSKTRRSRRVKCYYKTRGNKCYDKNNRTTRSNRRYRKHSKSYRMKGG